MAENKPVEAQVRPSVARQDPQSQRRDSETATQAAQDVRRGNSGQTEDPNAGARAATEAAHAARVSVPGHPTVDARLDNRQGRYRPPLESYPAKPQQIDGPDIIHHNEHVRATLDKLTEVEGDVKGMFSPGPHGLSDESLREGETSFGTEGLSVEDASKGAPKA